MSNSAMTTKKEKAVAEQKPVAVEAFALSPRTIEVYLPALRKVYSSLQVFLAAHPEPETAWLRFSYLEKEFGTSHLFHVSHLLSVWLKNSPFEVKLFYIWKKDKSAKWADFFSILDRKLAEYENGFPIIALSMDRHGRMTREIGGQTLTHDFESDGQKKEIILLLLGKRDFVKTIEIQEAVRAKNVPTTEKTIKAINSILRRKLQLPDSKKFIESKRGSGYRIDRIYNLVRLD
jgi:hypothetical protein